MNTENKKGTSVSNALLAQLLLIHMISSNRDTPALTL